MGVGEGTYQGENPLIPHSKAAIFCKGTVLGVLDINCYSWKFPSASSGVAGSRDVVVLGIKYLKDSGRNFWRFQEKFL